MFDFGGKEPNWIDENSSDGQTFYGFDQGDGTTDWYTEDGSLDSSSDTPCDDED